LASPLHGIVGSGDIRIWRIAYIVACNSHG